MICIDGDESFRTVGTASGSPGNVGLFAMTLIGHLLIPFELHETHKPSVGLMNAILLTDVLLFAWRRFLLAPA